MKGLAASGSPSPLKAVLICVLPPPGVSTVLPRLTLAIGAAPSLGLIASGALKVIPVLCGILVERVV